MTRSRWIVLAAASAVCAGFASVYSIVTGGQATSVAISVRGGRSNIDLRREHTDRIRSQFALEADGVAAAPRPGGISF
jgi:hypothetical protein